MPAVSHCAPTDRVELRSDQTVLRSLVHKHSIENVLLTGIRRDNHERFLCTGRRPVDHVFFNHAGRLPGKDILFYTELGRQASLAISHAFLDVSTDDVFIFEGSKARMAQAAFSPVPRPVRDPVVIEISIEDIVRRKNNVVNRVVAEHRMTIGSEEVFHGTGAWTIQSAALFRRLRKTAFTGPPSIVSHFSRRPSNVVITPPEPVGSKTSFVAALVVDRLHPYFFDHPCDHVPGMLLLEGCAQLAVAAFAETTSVGTGRSAICAYDVNFIQFVECGAPITLSAQVNAEDDVEIVISQQDVMCGTTTMRVAFPV